MKAPLRQFSTLTRAPFGDMNIFEGYFLFREIWHLTFETTNSSTHFIDFCTQNTLG